MGQVEEFEVKGEELMAKVREMVYEGSVRRLTIKDGNGRTLLDIPLTVGVVGAVFAPFAAAIGMVAALATDCTVTVVRDVDPDAEPGADTASDDAGAE